MVDGGRERPSGIGGVSFGHPAAFSCEEGCRDADAAAGDEPIPEPRVDRDTGKQPGGSPVDILPVGRQGVDSPHWVDKTRDSCRGGGTEPPAILDRAKGDHGNVLLQLGRFAGPRIVGDSD